MERSINENTIRNQVLSGLLSPIIEIDDVPDSSGTYCQVTLNIPWSVAEQVVATSLPVLNGMKDAVDLRTTKRKQREKSEANRERQRQEYHKEDRTALYYAIKQIHTHGIDYGEFVNRTRDRTPISFIYLRLSRQELHRIYHSVREWSVCRKHKQGVPVADIAAHYCLGTGTIYNIINKAKKEAS